jgi:hypothetical protein
LNFIRYISEPENAPYQEDPLQWWIKRKGKYPNLWKMARDLLGIPATSTPSERTFSRATTLYSKHRSRLLGDVAQALMNLGSWWGGEGLPGVKVPIIKHPKIEYAQKQKVIQLPKVNVDKYGNILFNEQDGWDIEDYDDAVDDDEDDNWEDESNGSLGGESGDNMVIEGEECDDEQYLEEDNNNLDDNEWEDADENDGSQKDDDDEMDNNDTIVGEGGEESAGSDDISWYDKDGDRVVHIEDN